MTPTSPTTSRSYASLVQLLGSVYGATTSVVDALDDDGFDRPTRISEWTVRELLFHQMLDAQRALIVFATPATDPADINQVSYWSAWAPGGSDSAVHARYVQQSAAAYAGPKGLRAQWRDTSAAALRAAAAHTGSGRVATQGHVLEVADFVHTLIVEAVVHHLDLTLEIQSPGVSDEGLDAVIEVLVGLLSSPLPSEWSPEVAVLKGTGRAELTENDRIALGNNALRFPLFG